MNNIILVTGVSNGESRQGDVDFIKKQFPLSNVVLFDPERYMEKTVWSKLTRPFALLNDATDVAEYFNNGAKRREIDYHFKRMIEKYKPSLLLAHSLGTVITYNNMAHLTIESPNTSVEFFNSPLWIPTYPERYAGGVYRGLTNKEAARNSTLAAAYSCKDVIAFMPISPKYVSRRCVQVDTKTSHNFQETYTKFVELVYPEYGGVL